MNDPAQLIKALETIKAMATVPGKKDKEKLLKQGDSEYLRTLLNLAYDRFKTYRIQQIEQPSTYNVVQPDTMEDFKNLCRVLASHTIGSNDAKIRIKDFLSLNTQYGAEIFTNVLLRDLRGGFDEKTCNKVFPGLVPTFNVQLANKVEDWGKIKFPTLVEEKLDGVRTLAIYDGEEVKFYSREGREFNECGVIAKQIKKLAPGMPFVLDGEFIATKYNRKSATCTKYAGGNWPFNYGLALVKTESKTVEEVEQHLGYFVWDLIDYEYFMSSGTRGHCDPLSQRKTRLTGLFLRKEFELPNVQVVPNFVCPNKEEVLRLFRKFRDKDKEGVMVKDLDMKYEFKRSNAVLKLKEFFTMDLRVVGAEEGTGKYVGMLGALVVADDEGKLSSKVGSGFTDEDRSSLWIDWLNGTLEGNIVEVQAQEVTKDGSLRFPTYERLRFDKTTTNTEGLV